MPKSTSLVLFSTAWLTLALAGAHAAELTASDGAGGNYFGISASPSGSIGLVGAHHDDSFRGSAYVYRNLDTATGAVTQNVKPPAP